jgi:hypothetical protein
MSTFDSTNSGILHRNNRKTETKHPDFAGTINVEGREYWLSGWVKESKEGSKLATAGIDKFFSLAVKAKDEQSKPNNDSIPF